MHKHAEDFYENSLGASHFMHLNYEDTKTGNKVGPTLLHLAITNEYIYIAVRATTDLIAASADFTNDEVPVYSRMKQTISLSRNKGCQNDSKDCTSRTEGQAILTYRLQAEAARAAELSGH